MYTRADYDRLFACYVATAQPKSRPDLTDVDLKYCWYVNRNNQGLRLSDLGYNIATTGLVLPCWRYAVTQHFVRPRNLLLMDRHMTCAYYLRRHGQQSELVLFGSQEAMMLSLHGDAEQYLQSLDRQAKS